MKLSSRYLLDRHAICLLAAIAALAIGFNAVSAYHNEQQQSSTPDDSAPSDIAISVLTFQHLTLMQLAPPLLAASGLNDVSFNTVYWRITQQFDALHYIAMQNE